MRIGIDRPPMRIVAVDPFEDLLPDRSVETAVALREARDAQPSGEARKRLG